MLPWENRRTVTDILNTIKNLKFENCPLATAVLHKAMVLQPPLKVSAGTWKESLPERAKGPLNERAEERSNVQAK